MFSIINPKTLSIKAFVVRCIVHVNIIMLLLINLNGRVYASPSVAVAAAASTSKPHYYGVTSIKSVNISISTSRATNTILGVANSVNNGSIASTLANHYQVITICNSLPSILKCQNRQHFLILHRVIYGLANTSGYHGAASCIPQTTCMQVDETDQFNCTGSNICVFYSIDRTLNSCNSLESNLTQIHITCVSLMHFKRYYTQLSNKQFDFQNRTHETNQSQQLATNNFYGANKNNPWFTTPNRTPKISINNNNSTITITNSPVMVSEFTFLERNSIVFIVMTVISSLIAVLVFLLAYYKIRMRQLNNMRNPIVTSSSDNSNVISINNKSLSDTEKILNINNNSKDMVANSPTNLFKSHQNNNFLPSGQDYQHYNYNHHHNYGGFNNKLLKLRTFFANLLHRRTSSQEKDYVDGSSSKISNNSSNNNSNNLNDAVFNKQSAKYYSIALNLMQGGGGGDDVYENTYCNCALTASIVNTNTNTSTTDGLICTNCFKKYNYGKNIDSNNNILVNGVFTRSSSQDANNSTTTIPLDLLNSSSLIPSSISLVHANANYVLYDIPEVDENFAENNEKDMTEYYYNQTEKI